MLTVVWDVKQRGLVHVFSSRHGKKKLGYAKRILVLVFTRFTFVIENQLYFLPSKWKYFGCIWQKPKISFQNNSSFSQNSLKYFTAYTFFFGDSLAKYSKLPKTKHACINHRYILISDLNYFGLNMSRRKNCLFTSFYPSKFKLFPFFFYINPYKETSPSNNELSRCAM